MHKPTIIKILKNKIQEALPLNRTPGKREQRAVTRKIIQNFNPELKDGDGQWNAQLKR